MAKLLILLLLNVIYLSICATRVFDYLMYTTIYPSGVCRAANEAAKKSCVIPPHTSTWTIHGLWPNYENGSHPQFCPIQERHFKLENISSIREELEQLWPNLYPSKTVTSFWKHEYEKHGTCAHKNSLLHDELHYFQRSMEVHNMLSIEQLLSDIGPSDKPINRVTFSKYLKEALGGKNGQFNCVQGKKKSKTYLGDIRICLDSNLNIRDCPDKKETNRIQSYPDMRKTIVPAFKPCPQEFYYPPVMSSASENNLSALSIVRSVGKALKKIWPF